jgi:hypothetical protein
VISVQKKSDLKRSLLNFWYGDYSWSSRIIPDSPLKGDASKTIDLRRLMVCTLRLDLALILASLRFSLVTPMADFLELQI